MKAPILFKLLAVCSLPFTGLAQSTITITFDGPPLTSPIPYYAESGMYFVPGSGNYGFFHGGLSSSPSFPDNGTPYLQGVEHAGYNNVYTRFIDGSTFGVSSIDMAAFGGDYIDLEARFYGLRSDNTVITASTSGTGLDFRTVYFGSEWSSGLVQFLISNDGSSAAGWSADNMLIIVPEPTIGALLLTGTLIRLAAGARRPNPKGCIAAERAAVRAENGIDELARGASKYTHS